MTRLLLVLAQLASAPSTLAAPQPVSVPASDGLVLRGTWHPSDRPTGRAVLLLHEMCGNRGAWAPFLEGLRAAGLSVLAVDLRGFGETGGKMDWDAEVADAGAWVAWMRAQPGVAADRIGVMGESLGAKLALAVCGPDASCRAAVALSPYGNVPAAHLNFRDRAVFLVGTRGDDVQSGLGVRRMAAEVHGDVTIRLVAGNEPGVATLLEGGESMVSEVIRWLDGHL